MVDGYIKFRRKEYCYVKQRDTTLKVGGKIN